MDTASRQNQAKIDHNAGFNCCQSVLLQYSKDFGIDRTIAARMASGFGGGMNHGKTCGAITGAIMVLGLACGYHSGDDQNGKERVKKQVRAFFEAFRAGHEDTDCYELLGMDITIAENRVLMRERGMSDSHCNCFITDAIMILDDILRACI